MALTTARAPIWALVLAFCALAFATGSGYGQSQVINPLFAQARTLMQQVSQAPIDANAKSRLQSRFNALSAEQQNLWRLAGEVDRKACTGACVASYNNRVVAWQRNLQGFNADAATALRSRAQQQQPAQPAGCVRAGMVRPSPVTGLVLWNFSNACSDARHVSVCAEYGSGQNNRLGSDIGPRNSADITLRSGYANLCWREGRDLPCPCPRR